MEVRWSNTWKMSQGYWLVEARSLWRYQRSWRDHGSDPCDASGSWLLGTWCPHFGGQNDPMSRSPNMFEELAFKRKKW